MTARSGLRPHPRRGVLLVLACSALFGVSASVGKVVLDAGVQPARLTALRCTGSALVLLVLVGATNRARLRVEWRDLPALALLGVTGAAVIQWLYFVAIDRLPVGIALLLEFTGPVMVAVYSRVVLKHAVHRQVWLAIGLCLTGLALVAQVWRDVGLDPVGVAAGFGAALCLATFYLLGKHSLETRDPLTLSFWMFAFAALFWAIAQPWWSFDPAVLGEKASLLGALERFDVPVWLALAWIILLGTLAPYALGLASMRHLTATTTGVIGMIEPVIAAAVAWVWLDQVLSAVQLAGGALVLVGVGLVQLRAADQPSPSLPTTLPDSMTPDDLVEIEQIKRLKYRYCRCLDQKRFDEMAALFTEDATASYGGGAHVLEGREAIVDWLRGAMASTAMLTSHQVSQPEIDLVTPDEATGSWSLQDIVLLPDAGLTIRGASFYEDRYRKVAGEWHIQHTGYKRLFEEIEPRRPEVKLTASWWGTDGRSTLSP